MVERPIGGRANGRCGRGLEWRHRGDFRKPCTGLRGEARASLCIIIPVRAARCALQLLGQARVCAFLSSSSPSSPSSSSSYFCTLAGASSLPFSTSTPRRPSHDAHRRRIIIAYARVEKALAGCRWTRASVRARARLCVIGDVQLNHAVRASVLSR